MSRECRPKLSPNHINLVPCLLFSHLVWSRLTIGQCVEINVGFTISNKWYQS